MRRPEVLFVSPVERAVTALDNYELVTGQVLCAAAELPLQGDDAARFGPKFGPALEDLETEGLVTRGPAGITFSGDFRPASVVRLDGRADDAVEVRVEGEILEVMERWRAMRSAHEGAVLIHRGQRYRVVHFDLEAGRADAEPVAGRDYTETVVVREYRLGDPLKDDRGGKVGSSLFRVGS